jgi:hypothetical protein
MTISERYTGSEKYTQQVVLGRTNRLLPFHMTQTAQKTTRPTILLLGVFVAEGAYLPSRCLATIGGDTHTQTDGRDL